MNTACAEDEAASEQVPCEQVVLGPLYHQLRNRILQPEEAVVSSRYFWQRWAPRLGPVLTVLIVHLRLRRVAARGRRLRLPALPRLARALGVSVAEAEAALAHPLARYFVAVEEVRSTRRPERPPMRRFWVAVDDPLTPEDESVAARLAAAMADEGCSGGVVGHRPVVIALNERQAWLRRSVEGFVHGAHAFPVPGPWGSHTQGSSSPQSSALGIGRARNDEARSSD